jgi:hypothetical protein
MAFMESILKPCQRKVLFEREYSAEQNTMIYKCEYVMRAVAINCKSEYVMRAVAINCKSLTANQAEQMDKFAMMGIYNGGCFNCPKNQGTEG